VVWGALEDTITAAEEVRLRYVDAMDGVPNETRQPFPDGSTDFERILPGPDRMYPDTDSPPVGMTRERVEKLRAALAPPPWEREARYAAAGVSRPTIYYLIRRGGAALVDRVVKKSNADLHRACVFFGERVKGYRRAGLEIDLIPAERYEELFRIAAEMPVLWEAEKAIVKAMVQGPSRSVAALCAEAGLGSAPAGWQSQVKEAAAQKPAHLRMGSSDEARLRFVMGVVMRRLRGRVPAAEVTAEIARHIGRR
jgi:glutamyl-tRNA(Gln) amidotransferase subunit E